MIQLAFIIAIVIRIYCYLTKFIQQQCCDSEVFQLSCIRIDPGQKRKKENKWALHDPGVWYLVAMIVMTYGGGVMQKK